MVEFGTGLNQSELTQTGSSVCESRPIVRPVVICCSNKVQLSRLGPCLACFSRMTWGGWVIPTTGPMRGGCSRAIVINRRPYNLAV